MSAVKKYFKNQFKKEMFLLENDTVSLFYLSSFTRNRSAAPLFFLRGILFLGCILIVIASIVLTATTSFTSVPHWPIYLTHWGIMLITLASGLGFAVSARVYFKGPIDATFGLPWYVKTYWAIYSTAIPIAFFITVFYWTFLSDLGDETEYAPNKTLDIFIHGINSIVMFVLLISARQPTNFLHFYFPILLGIAYALFTVIYQFAGGKDQFGNVWIYPMLDWTNPGIGALTILFSAIIIFIMHMLAILFTVTRDAISRAYRKDAKTFSLSM